MSTYMGIKCQTDGAQTTCGVNHHEHALLTLIRHAKLIRDVLAADLPIEMKTEFYWDSFDDELGLLEFLSEHAEHELRLYDEYGYDYDADGNREEHK